jgi:DNA polymerase III gamma/tau subunit
VHVYRLSELVGNTETLAILKRTVETGKLRNLTILDGVIGTGKSSAAEAIVLTSLCETRVNGEACLKCSSCKTVIANFRANLDSMNVIKKNIPELKYDKSKSSLRDLIKEIFEIQRSGAYYILEEVDELPKEDHAIFREYVNGMQEDVHIIMTTNRLYALDKALVSRAGIPYTFRPLNSEQSRTLAIRTAKILGQTLEEDTLRIVIATSKGVARDIVLSVTQIVTVGITQDELEKLVGHISDKTFSSLLAASRDSTQMFIYRVERLLQEVSADRVCVAFKEFLINLTLWEETQSPEFMGKEEAKEALDVVSKETLTRMVADSARLGSSPSSTDIKMFFIRWKRKLSGGVTAAQEAAKDSYVAEESRSFEIESSNNNRPAEAALDAGALQRLRSRREVSKKED